MDAAGDFVIGWASGGGQDGSNNGVYAQRYNAAGTAQGSEFKVNSYTTGSQSLPSVGMDAAGNFVFAWTSDNNEDGSGDGIYAQRYNAAGATQGTEFKANSYTTGAQSGPAVGVDAGGDFVIAWTSDNSEDGSSYGVYGQRYTPAGATVGSETRLNAYTTNSQSGAAVAMDASGDYVTAWAGQSAPTPAASPPAGPPSPPRPATPTTWPAT